MSGKSVSSDLSIDFAHLESVQNPEEKVSLIVEAARTHLAEGQWNEAENLDRTIKKMVDVGRKLHLGAGNQARLRQALMELRRSILVRQAAASLRNSGDRKDRAFGALAFLRAAGTKDAREALRAVKFKDSAMERIRRDGTKVSRTTMASTPELPSESTPATPEKVGYNEVLRKIKRALGETHEPQPASVMATRGGLPLWEVQWVLEDLVETGYASRRCQAVRRTDEGHCHTSEILGDWRALVGRPVRCTQCPTWILPSTSEVFLSYHLADAAPVELDENG